SGVVAGKNNGATGEPLEPTHINASATSSSVWYTWTPTQSGTAVFDPAANFGINLAVYTGNALGALTRLSAASSSRVTFAALAGTTYNIAVGGNTASDRGN